ncbi:MAG: ribose-5-phosphate isomerase, partial [Firmicutes bacterium]|nr:ribose-5-phosphate isomerase [Bacillota bacterium]
GSHVIGEGLAKEIVRVWLSTEFEGGRHSRRVDKILNLEKRLFQNR